MSPVLYRISGIEVRPRSVRPDHLDHQCVVVQVKHVAPYRARPGRPEQWRRYSNWGTFETSGLALVALMFPELERSELWLHEVWFRMRFQLQNSFTSDGMHVEASPSYHAHELEVWLDFLRLAEENAPMTRGCRVSSRSRCGDGEEGRHPVTGTRPGNAAMNSRDAR